MKTAQHSFTPELFLRPLSFLRLEHRRQLEISDWLIEVANNQKLELLFPKAEPLLVFLRDEVPVHHRDEEENLFPMLRRRCRPEDQVETILAELNQDHAVERFLRLHIIMELAVISKGGELESPWRLFSDLLCFAEGQKRHLVWENKVVLPLADRRLIKEDLLTLGCNMALRRGIG
jgi:hemerythrin-like domain-containing protein